MYQTKEELLSLTSGTWGFVPFGILFVLLILNLHFHLVVLHDHTKERVMDREVNDRRPIFYATWLKQVLVVEGMVKIFGSFQKTLGPAEFG